MISKCTKTPTPDPSSPAQSKPRVRQDLLIYIYSVLSLAVDLRLYRHAKYQPDKTMTVTAVNTTPIIPPNPRLGIELVGGATFVEVAVVCGRTALTRLGNEMEDSTVLQAVALRTSCFICHYELVN